jgi:signal transduction histidine kinase/CheY-like chemotaxis protein
VEKKETLQIAFHHVMDHGNWIGELRSRTKAGKAVIVQSHWSLMRHPDGSPKAILVINTDITERKQLETQFLRAQRMESIGTLAGAIAHDLNNCLAPIVMAAPFLREQLQDLVSQRMLDSVENSAKRGADIVKQLLVFARGIQGDRIALQLNHLVRDMAQIIRETFPKNIQLNIESAKDLATVQGDTTQLHQVLLNLCVNARDAMPDGGMLSLKTQNIVLDEPDAKMIAGAKPGSYVLLTVTDTGTGIPPEIMDKIFEPFFTTKSHEKGTGLGLSTTLGIVKSHSGFIQVNSTVGQGATFEVYLPAIAAVEAQADVTAPGQLPRGHGELILLVDDESPVRTVTKRALEKFGYQVLEASDGTEAVSLYASNRDAVKAVLTDMSMPHLDGPGTIRALRRMNPDLPIIGASGLSSKVKPGQLDPLNLQAYLQKPFSAEKLLTALHQALRGAVEGLKG